MFLFMRIIISIFVFLITSALTSVGAAIGSGNEKFISVLIWIGVSIGLFVWIVRGFKEVADEHHMQDGAPQRRIETLKLQETYQKQREMQTKKNKNVDSDGS